MSQELPFDSTSRRIDSRACAILHYLIDSNHWIYRDLTGQDVGCDCVLELSENDRFCNRKVEGQIKGTENISRYALKTTQAYSFPLEIKTINYALGSSRPFLLFLVDVTYERIFYVEIQNLFICNKELFDRLEEAEEKQRQDSKEERTTKRKLNLHIPFENALTENDADLQMIAHRTYVGGPSRDLKLAT